MRAIFATVMIIVLIASAVISGHIAENHRQRAAEIERVQKVEEQLRRELDQASEQLQILIRNQKARLPKQYVFAEPPFLAAGDLKWEVTLKLQYLRWQIEILIALQQIQSGSPGTPIGAVNR